RDHRAGVSARSAGLVAGRAGHRPRPGRLRTPGTACRQLGTRGRHHHPQPDQRAAPGHARGRARAGQSRPSAGQRSAARRAGVGRAPRAPRPRVRRFLAQVRTLVWKDLLVEARGRETVLAGAIFALLVLVIFNFAFDLRVEDVAAVAPGVLWTTV